MSVTMAYSGERLQAPYYSRTVSPMEEVTIHRECGHIYLPSKQRLLHKMAEIVIGRPENPVEVVALFWGVKIGNVPYYQYGSDNPAGHQLVVAGRLQTKRLQHDKEHPIPKNITSLVAIRGKNVPIRIDSIGSFDRRFPGAEQLPTAAWATLLDENVLQIKGGSLEAGTRVVAAWTDPPGIPEQRPNQEVRRFPLRLVTD